MKEYIKKLEDENQKLQETVSLYQSRYGDIYETIANEESKRKLILEPTSEIVTGQLVSGTLKGGDLFSFNNVGVSIGNIIQSSDVKVWQPQEDSKKLQKELNELKNIIVNKNKPFYKRYFRVIIRKMKRKFK